MNDIKLTLFMKKVTFMLSKSQSVIPNLTHTLALGDEPTPSCETKKDKSLKGICPFSTILLLQ